MRAAAARAASRRGSSTRIVFPCVQGSLASTSGTRVVLPAPAARRERPRSVCARQRSVPAAPMDGKGLCVRAHPMHIIDIMCLFAILARLAKTYCINAHGRMIRVVGKLRSPGKLWAQ